MGIYSHDHERPPERWPERPVPKPPGVPPRDCEWKGCNSSAAWSISEVSFCGHHLPNKYIFIAQERKAMWTDMGAELWRDICAELPVEDS